MTGIVVLLGVLVWCTANTWWEWWLATRRRPLGEELAKLRTRTRLSTHVAWVLAAFGLVVGIGEVVDSGGPPWLTMAVFGPAVVINAVGSRAARRALDDSPATAPPADLLRNVQRLRRARLPLALGFAAFAGVLEVIGGDVSVALVLAGPVLGGLFMYLVLTLLLLAGERATRPGRAR